MTESWSRPSTLYVCTTCDTELYGRRVHFTRAERPDHHQFQNQRLGHDGLLCKPPARGLRDWHRFRSQRFRGRGLRSRKSGHRRLLRAFQSIRVLCKRRHGGARERRRHFQHQRHSGRQQRDPRLFQLSHIRQHNSYNISGGATASGSSPGTSLIVPGQGTVGSLSAATVSQ